MQMVKVIPWISMVFSLLSLARSVPKDDKIGVCYKNVSSTQYRTVTYRQSYKNFWGYVKYEIKTRKMSNRMWVRKEVCCPGYVQTSNKSCEAQCSPACVNGYCMEPNICKCNFGWGSDVCNETTVCVIAAETVEAKSLGSEIPENAPENPLIAQHTEYACRPGCQREVNNPNANLTRTANTTYYFVSIDSPCNAEDAAMRLSRSKKYGYAIGGTVITIIIVAIVIFVVLKQRRTRTLPTKSAPMPVSPFSNYMEENTIYAGTDVVL